MTENKKIYTPQFGLLCLSSFLFFASFNMIVPELPDYLTSLGGGEYKGLIISLFTITAGLSRPFSGKLADTIGRIPVMIFGAGICFIIGFLYPVFSSIWAFFLLRLAHGLSTGFKPTGTAAYVADIVPDNRRGEAMGISGLFASLGMAGGPSIGSAIASTYSLELMFYASSVAAILSVLILIGMKETLPHKKKFSPKLLFINRDEIIEPRAFNPSIVMILTTFSFGVVLTIIPDLSKALGLMNKGTFFTVFVISSLAVRFIAGKASDKYGRVIVLKFSTIFLTLADVVIALSTSQSILYVGGVLFGIAIGMNSPTIYAWTIDLSLDAFRGKALATMYIALEIGIGLGAFMSGWLYSNEISRIKLPFTVSAILSFVAFLYLSFGLRWTKHFRRKVT